MQLLGMEPEELPAGDLPAALDLLAATAWDGPAPAALAARDALYAPLGLPAPVQALAHSSTTEKAGGEVGAAVVTCRDEFATYGALLCNAGREI